MTATMANPYGGANPGMGVWWTESNYSVQSGGSQVTTTCSGLSVTTTAPAGASPNTPVNADIAWKAIIYPIMINPVGATQDSSGNWSILVGQQCKPTLQTPDGHYTASNFKKFHWHVSGTTFQSWAPNTAGVSTYSTYVDGPGALTVANPAWYWNDATSGTQETIKCDATFVAPDGTTDLVSATVDVTVYLPAWTAYGIGGKMQVNSSYSSNYPSANSPAGDTWLYAGPANTDNPGGFNVTATIMPPPNTAFGAGTLELVQLFTVDDSYVDKSNKSHTDVNNNQGEGLDTDCPYGWSGENPYYAGDAPGLDLTALNAKSAHMDDTFCDYLMFLPPGSNQPVPLAQLSWVASGDWPGILSNVTPSSQTNFSASNQFPSWTRNTGAGIHSPEYN